MRPGSLTLVIAAAFASCRRADMPRGLQSPVAASVPISAGTAPPASSTPSAGGSGKRQFAPTTDHDEADAGLPYGVTPAIAHFYLAFREAVLRDDRSYVASQILYPIEVYLDGKRGHVTKIRNPREFISLYDRIMLEGIKRVIAKCGVEGLASTREEIRRMTFPISHAPTGRAQRRARLEADQRSPPPTNLAA